MILLRVAKEIQLRVGDRVRVAREPWPAPQILAVVVALAPDEHGTRATLLPIVDEPPVATLTVRNSVELAA